MSAPEANLDEMKALLPPGHPAHAILDELRCLNGSLDEFVTVEVEDVAARAGETLIRLKPNERFNRLLGALRALDGDGSIIEHSSHGHPLGDSEHSSLDDQGSVAK